MKMEVPSSKWERGVTLIEALVVIALIGLLTAVFTPFFLGMLQRYRAQTAAEQIEVNLRYARYAAVKTKLRHQILIRDNGFGTPELKNTYVVLQDKDGDRTFDTDTEATNNDTTLPHGIIIVGGSIDEVTFNARGAATITGGSDIKIQTQDGTIWSITVQTNGSVAKVQEA
jgi:prepilin-type N-terminal cleavage/methylation domain-containing protein